MFRCAARWFGVVAVCGLLVLGAGCGNDKNVDPVVVPQENQKDQPQFKPSTRGGPQSSENLTSTDKKNKNQK
jgi:hypothetical protein